MYELRGTAGTGDGGGRRSPAVALVCLVFACLVLAPRAAHAARIDVDVAGIDGDERANVLSALSIARLADEKRVDERQVRDAHARAAGEIETALQPFGYYRPRVESALRKDGRKYRATYRVDKGPPLRVGKLTIRVTGEALTGGGSGSAGFREAADAFPLREGDLLNHVAYEQGKGAFLDYAAEHGYLDASFEVAEIRIDRDRYASEIVLHFDTGPQYLFGSLQIRQDILDGDIVSGFAPFRRGEPVSVGKVLKFQNGLSDSRYFSRVEVRADRSRAEGRYVPVDVRLTPADRTRWHAGVGYGTDTGPRFTGQLELRRINRRGHRGESWLTASGIEQSLDLRYIVPRPPPSTDSLTYAIGYADLRSDTSEEQLALVSATYTRTRRKWVQSYGLGYRRENFTVGTDEGRTGLLVPEVNFSRTSADDRVYPLRGHRIDLRLRGAAENVLSDVSFARAQARLQWVRGLTEDVRVLARVDGGIMWSPDFRQLPAAHRFFAGGDQSVRGFDFQEIGDLDDEGNVIGGTRLLVASVEADWLFLEKWGKWGVALFADAGDAGSRLDLFSRRGVGAGIRWLSPVGMVRIDVATAISEPGSPVRLHLSLGPDL